MSSLKPLMPEKSTVAGIETAPFIMRMGVL